MGRRDPQPQWPGDPSEPHRPELVGPVGSSAPTRAAGTWSSSARLTRGAARVRWGSPQCRQKTGAKRSSQTPRVSPTWFSMLLDRDQRTRDSGVLTTDLRFLTWPVTLWLETVVLRAWSLPCVRGGAIVDGGRAVPCAPDCPVGVAGAGSGGDCSAKGSLFSAWRGVGLSSEGASTTRQAAASGALRTPRPS